MKKLIDYLPDFLKNIKDYKLTLNSIDIELNLINENIENIIKESSILTADEKRIQEWEQFLKIQKIGNLYQRKLYIIATITSVGKINKTKIEEIVNIYTGGGGADVSFDKDTSTIKVKVKPPQGAEIFRFDDIERTLNIMIPAHLNLNITRFYVFWENIKEDFPTWQALKDTNMTWKQVKFYTGITK